MVNKENMRLWVAALRSGDYQQGRELLKSLRPGEQDPRYCCMGVVCEVAKSNGVPLNEFQQPTAGGHILFHFDSRASYLPVAVIDWLGLGRYDEDPCVGSGVTASRANDIHLWTFRQIADRIEQLYHLNED